MSSQKKRRTLRRWTSGDAESAAVIFSVKSGLKSIRETDHQRQFKNRDMKACFRAGAIEESLVYEFLVTAVARVIHQMASLLQVSWLPACMLVPVLNTHENYCLCCRNGGGLQGKSFFDYVLEHYATIVWENLDTHSYVHAGHCWAPVADILQLLHANVALFKRKFLNAHQVYDSTSWDLHLFMRTQEFRKLDTKAQDAILFIYRAWFNDWQRFSTWRSLIFSIDIVVDAWADDAALAKRLAKRNEFDFSDVDVDRVARSLFQETCVAGGQPNRGYLKSTYKTPPGTSKIHQIAKLFVDMLNGASDGSEFGEYSIYRFMVFLDKYYFNELSNDKMFPGIEPMTFVGPGCPSYLATLAPGYCDQDKVLSGTVYDRSLRKKFEPFLADAETALHKMPLYRWLRERHLIPPILACNLQGTSCEMRKPEEDSWHAPLRHATTELDAKSACKLRTFIKHAAKN